MSLCMPFCVSGSALSVLLLFDLAVLLVLSLSLPLSPQLRVSRSLCANAKCTRPRRAPAILASAIEMAAAAPEYYEIRPAYSGQQHWR